MCHLGACSSRISGLRRPNLQRYQQRQTAHSGQVVARGEEQMFGVVREGRAEES